MKVLHCGSHTQPGALDAVVAEARQISSQFGGPANARILVLFFGAEDPDTHQSWCPDCVVADPVIRRQVLAYEEVSGKHVILCECSVGSRQAWKSDPQHPFKLHPAFRVERIPTLVRVTDDSAAAGWPRLVEDACRDANQYPALLAA